MGRIVRASDFRQHVYQKCQRESEILRKAQQDDGWFAIPDQFVESQLEQNTLLIRLQKRREIIRSTVILQFPAENKPINQQIKRRVHFQQSRCE